MRICPSYNINVLIVTDWNIAAENSVRSRRIEEVILEGNIASDISEFASPGNHTVFPDGLELVTITLYLDGATVVGVVGEDNWKGDISVEAIQTCSDGYALASSNCAWFRVWTFCYEVIRHK